MNSYATKAQEERKEPAQRRRQATTGSGGVSLPPGRHQALQDRADGSSRVRRLEVLQAKLADGPQARSTARLEGIVAHGPAGSGVVQRVTGVGVLGGLGAIAAGTGYLAGLPYLLPAGLAVAGGSALYKWWRGAPATEAPTGKKVLGDEETEPLSKFRAERGIEPLDVRWDAAITDEVAGRRREPDAYRQWQIGRAEDGRPIGRNGEPLNEGRYMYVVTSGNEFRYLPMKSTKEHWEQYRTHSQLSGKQQVYAAGAFNVNGQGWIVEIDNESGHYRPAKQENAEYARLLLGHLGVEVAGTATRAHDTGKDPQGLAWWMAQGKANLRALRTWLPQKAGTGWKHGLAEPGPELEKELPF